ncbi:hypothetical protein Tdes44962_MAKER09787 [Teratosphaeria destructans]|uniref:Uncharacterized protein n=1 Tax=Teratosphaeria destructans TaxID=418781 RepID=A0A9W7SRG4_9PEZI|nr:hypothetical protein Tdes44962_MAKER09787 [Teratosphaeria destructans]
MHPDIDFIPLGPAIGFARGRNGRRGAAVAGMNVLRQPNAMMLAQAAMQGYQAAVQDMQGAKRLSVFKEAGKEEVQSDEERKGRFTRFVDAKREHEEAEEVFLEALREHLGGGREDEKATSQPGAKASSINLPKSASTKASSACHSECKHGTSASNDTGSKSGDHTTKSHHTGSKPDHTHVDSKHSTHDSERTKTSSRSGRYDSKPNHATPRPNNTNTNPQHSSYNANQSQRKSSRSHDPKHSHPKPSSSRTRSSSISSLSSPKNKTPSHQHHPRRPSSHSISTAASDRHHRIADLEHALSERHQALLQAQQPRPIMTPDGRVMQSPRLTAAAPAHPPYPDAPFHAIPQHHQPGLTQRAQQGGSYYYDAQPHGDLQPAPARDPRRRTVGGLTMGVRGWRCRG